MDNKPLGQDGSHTVTGLLIGLVAALLLWIFPLPVAMIIWACDLKGLFADYMYLAVPFFLMIPPAGAFVGSLIRKNTDPRK